MKTGKLTNWIVTKVLTAMGVALATCIGWALFEISRDSSLDNMTAGLVRHIDRITSGLLGMDPLVATIVLPLVVLSVLVVGAALFSNSRG